MDKGFGSKFLFNEKTDFTYASVYGRCVFLFALL